MIKTILLFLIRAIALTITFFICFSLASGIFIHVPVQDTNSSRQTSALQMLLLVSFLNSMILAYPILRSRWFGWKLIAAQALALYGIMYFMPQIETLAFSAVANRLPQGMIQGLFLAGLVLAVLYSPLSVLIMGKMKGAPDAETNIRLQMPLKEWLWKLAAIIVAYEILYFSFGYYVAWKNPLLQAYYGGTDPGSFLAQLRSIMRVTPWLFAFQAVRALLWTAIILPVVRMMKGRAWETSLVIGLLFAVVMNSQLLLPNPYMPREVAMTHLVETASSNFIFGVFIGYLLLWKQSPKQ